MSLDKSAFLRRPTALLAVGFFLIICLSPAIAQRPAIEDVPMLFRGSEPAIEVMANGQGPFLFAIDTGANDLARLDTSLVKRLGLQIIGNSRTGDLSARNTELDTVRVDSITIGNLEFRNVRALSRNYNRIANLPRIDGILCFDLFFKYLLTLDYPAQRVRLQFGELPQPDGAEILKLKSTSGLPAIDLMVAGYKVNALIDSGNLVDGILLPTFTAPYYRAGCTLWQSGFALSTNRRADGSQLAPRNNLLDAGGTSEFVIDNLHVLPLFPVAPTQSFESFVGTHLLCRDAPYTVIVVSPGRGCSTAMIVVNQTGIQHTRLSRDVRNST